MRFRTGMIGNSLRSLIEPLVAGFLLGFVKVASVLLPNVRHFPESRIVEKRILWALLLSHALARMLELLALGTVSDDLLLLAIESIGEDARLKRALHGNLL